jgi:branched-chain amino acid transport system ATP-binding protein
MKILQVKKITKRFGELAAVKDLSFEVEKAETFGIAGPNGAGKTTLFNLITGFYHGSGDIVFDNVNISRLRPHQICHKGIARTFQIPQLFLTLPVFENVRVGAHFGVAGAHDEKKSITEAINFVGLQRRENVIAANLSLYDKKLTMMGMALATKPKLLLVDEPIGGLSPTETKQFMDLIQKANKELGLTIIVIEHLMKVLTTLCQRLLIMESGERIALGPPEEVCRNEKVIEIYLGSGKHA